jgi:hypothetical protein
MLPKITPPQRNFLVRGKSIRISKSFLRFEDDQIDRDRYIQKGKKRIKKLNNIINSVKK